MRLSITVIDAFTDRPFAGNPAAVCVLPDERSDEWMQQVACEMNLAATAFLLRTNGGFRLRWFSSATELALCGHATLAAAHLLYADGQLTPDSIARFHTQAGLLTARRVGERIELDFPAEPAQPVEPPLRLIEALGVAPRFVGRNRLDYLVEVATADEVRQLAPDLALLQQVETRGVMVTSRSNEPYDFVSRFFAPRVGIPEDPVTGSAHCCLAPFWAERLQKTVLRAHQASSRGGVLDVEVVGERVQIRGQAVSVLRAQLLA